MQGLVNYFDSFVKTIFYYITKQLPLEQNKTFYQNEKNTCLYPARSFRSYY
jgi:hypothetical protein